MGGQGLGSGRARRDAAARAMQGWHSQKLLGNGEVGYPILKVCYPSIYIRFYGCNHLFHHLNIDFCRIRA